MPMRLKEA